MNSNEAMREALLALKKLDFNKEEDCYAFYRIIDEALALPRRQCDVGTFGEQYNRYAEFCEQHYREYSVGKCEKCPFAEPTCKFAWAQMPYEEGGAK